MLRRTAQAPSAAATIQIQGGDEAMLKTCLAKLDKASAVVSSCLLGIMMVILFYNVCARYIFGGGIQWYMESTQYLNVWAVMIGCIGVSATGGHLRVTLVEDLLPGKAKMADKILVGILNTVFFLFLAYGTFLLASKSKQDISTMAPLKMAYVYWMLPVTAILNAVTALGGMIVDITECRKGGAEK